MNTVECCFWDREVYWVLSQEVLFRSMEHCVLVTVSCDPDKAFSWRRKNTSVNNYLPQSEHVQGTLVG